MFLKFSCSGPKYEFAKKWKIHIVKSDWLYDSIEKGYCLEEKQFALSKDAGEKSEVKTSTPEKESGPRGKGLIRVGGGGYAGEMFQSKKKIILGLRL